MRTTFACRDFTDDHLPDEVIYEMIEKRPFFRRAEATARENRVIIVRDMATRQRLSDLTIPVAKRLPRPDRTRGEKPLGVLGFRPSSRPSRSRRLRRRPMLTEPLIKSSVVLVVCVDLKVVAATDQYLAASA